MRTDDYKIAILKIFKGKEFHGYEAHKRLASEDIEIEISRLYRILNEMLREGLLEGRWARSQLGPKMRVYRVGKKGEEELNRILNEAIETVHYFYSEYLRGLPSEVNAFNIICSLLLRDLNEKANFIYINAQFSTPHERLIRGLHSEIPEAKIYLVKPSSLIVDLKLDNLVLLDGLPRSIPLRDSYADLIVVTDIPKQRSLEIALSEWCRVLKQDGKLALIVPTVNVKKYEDPMDIGDFLEKHEHEANRNDDYINETLIERTLKKAFRKVEEKQVIHITIIQASEKILKKSESAVNQSPNSVP